MAYQAGHYVRALRLYAYLSRTTTLFDPAVRLNLGHTFFKLRQYDKAKSQYEPLLQSDRSELRTIAATQLGVLACLDEDSARALVLFKQALLENMDNEAARYNFELVKTYYSGKPPAKRKRPRGAKPKPDMINRSQPMGGQQVERSDRQDELLRRFQRLNLNEAQAMQLLDAMRDDDLPYALTRAARQTGKKTKETGNRW